MFYNCLYSLCRPCFLVSLVPLARIQQFCPLFGLHANIVEEYVLLSALLHDQSCLQSSPCFQHQLVWLPFSRTLVCKGGCSFHVHGSTRVVSSSLCYVAVSRARENNWDKPLLDVIIIDCLCPCLSHSLCAMNSCGSMHGVVMHDNSSGVHVNSRGALGHRNSCNLHAAGVRGGTKAPSMSTRMKIRQWKQSTVHISPFGVSVEITPRRVGRESTAGSKLPFSYKLYEIVGNST